MKTDAMNLPDGVLPEDIDALTEPEEVQCPLCKRWVAVGDEELDDWEPILVGRGSDAVVCGRCAGEYEG